MKSVKSGVIATGVLALSAGAAFADTLPYADDFNTGVGSGWTIDSGSLSTLTLDKGALHETVLGDFVNQTATLMLSGLAAGESVTVSFQFYALNAWNGNAAPDRFTVGVAGGPTLLDTTFSNVPGSQQSFPDAYLMGAHDPQTGAVEKNDISNFNAFGSSRYDFTFSFVAPSPTLTLNFTGSGLGGAAAQSWALDNLSVVARGVTTVPVPEAALAGLSGLAMAGGMSVRRKAKLR